MQIASKLLYVDLQEKHNKVGRKLVDKSLQQTQGKEGEKLTRRLNTPKQGHRRPLKKSTFLTNGLPAPCSVENQK